MTDQTPLETNDSAPTDAPADVDASTPDVQGTPEAKPDNGTIIDGVDGDAVDGEGDEGGGKGRWPDDWREQIAGDDKKLLGRLKRYSSFESAMKAGLSAQDKIRSGEMRQPLSEDATDEQKAEWRKANGIPEKPDGYELPKIDGYEWSDEDKEAAKGFLERAHGNNLTQEQAQAALSWYAETMAEVQQQQYDRDTQSRQELEDHLRLEWGQEYRANIKMMARYAEQIPGVGSELLAARMPDGSRLGENKDFISWMTDKAREHYGDSSFVAGDGGSTIAKRREEIEKIMRENIDQYYSQGLDKEYRKILDAEEKQRR